MHMRGKNKNIRVKKEMTKSEDNWELGKAI